MLRECNSYDQALALVLNEEEWDASRLGQWLADDVKHILTEQKSTINFHHWCLTPENFTHFGLGT